MLVEQFSFRPITTLGHTSIQETIGMTNLDTLGVLAHCRVWGFSMGQTSNPPVTPIAKGPETCGKPKSLT